MYICWYINCLFYVFISFIFFNTKYEYTITLIPRQNAFQIDNAKIIMKAGHIMVVVY